MPLTEKLLLQISQNQVSTLDFSDYVLPIQELAQLVGVLYYNNSVEKLNLSSSAALQISCKYSAGSIIVNLTNALITSRIKCLNLSNTKISNIEINIITKIFERSTTLTELHLSKNFISNIGAEQLFSALKTNASLNSLWLDSNLITDKAFGSLFSLLGVNKTITYIDLSSNVIAGWGINSLPLSLGSSKGYTVMINLRQNKIEKDYYVDRLKSILETNKSIKFLIDAQDEEGTVPPSKPVPAEVLFSTPPILKLVERSSRSKELPREEEAGEGHVMIGTTRLPYGDFSIYSEDNVYNPFKYNPSKHDHSKYDPFKDFSRSYENIHSEFNYITGCFDDPFDKEEHKSKELVGGYEYYEGV